MRCPLAQVPRYQKDVNVKSHEVTKEYKSIKKILDVLPKELKVFDIACAEGFLVYVAKKAGFQHPSGIEIDPGRTERGMKHMDIEISTGSIFDNMNMLEDYDCFIISRFFHNVGMDASVKLMDEISKKEDVIIINKYKPGPKKENGKPRELLATKKGINQLMEKYGFEKKSFPQDVIVAAKGKYVMLLAELRKHIGEG